MSDPTAIILLPRDAPLASCMTLVKTLFVRHAVMPVAVSLSTPDNQLARFAAILLQALADLEVVFLRT